MSSFVKNDRFHDTYTRAIVDKHNRPVGLAVETSDEQLIGLLENLLISELDEDNELAKTFFKVANRNSFSLWSGYDYKMSLTARDLMDDDYKNNKNGLMNVKQNNIDCIKDIDSKPEEIKDSLFFVGMRLAAVDCNNMIDNMILNIEQKDGE